MAKRSGVGGVLIIVGIVGFFALIAVLSSYTPIEYGRVGMVTRFGGITNRIMQPGLNWKLPFVERVVIYRTQELVYATMAESDIPGPGTYADLPTDTTTADGQQITVKYSVRFRIDPERITQIANEIGDESQVVEKVVKFHSVSWHATSPKGTRLWTSIQATSSRCRRDSRSSYARCCRPRA